LRFQRTCYRAHDPQWAFEPLSGEGARLSGGRFNLKGQAALYLTLTIEGVFLEMSHGFAHRFDPLTVCCYEVDVSDIVDLRTNAGRKKAQVTLKDLGCPWALDLAEGREPASWKVARRLLKEGAAGILVPSFARRADQSKHRNLVLWKWGAKLPHRITVYDPSSRLPRNQSSWK
jgi:RES domain-containing protein